MEAVPIHVLDTQLVPQDNVVVSKQLIQWDSVSNLQTWEDELDIRHRYPQALAWGQAAFQGGESVMTRKERKRQLRLAQRQARREDRACG